MDEDIDRLRGRDDGREPLESRLASTPSDNRLAWVGLIVLVAAIVGALWWWAPRTSESPAEAIGRVPTEEVVERPVPQVQGLGVGTPDPNLPPLGNLDGYVRPLLAVLSSRPELAALLASDGLVRRFAVSVEAIARGASPARPGPRRRTPRAVPGAAAGRRPDRSIRPATQRYDGLVTLVEDMEPGQLARLYGRLKPRLEEAYAELGAGGTFDEAMTRTIRHLLAAPLPPPNARIEPAKGTNYAYSDAAFRGPLGSAEAVVAARSGSRPPRAGAPAGIRHRAGHPGRSAATRS